MKTNHYKLVDDVGSLKLEVEVNRETGFFDGNWYIKFSEPMTLLYRLCYYKNRTTASLLYDESECFGMIIHIEKDTKETDLKLVGILGKQFLAITKNDIVVPLDLRKKVEEIFSNPLYYITLVAVK